MPGLFGAGKLPTAWEPPERVEKPRDTFSFSCWSWTKDGRKSERERGNCDSATYGPLARRSSGWLITGWPRFDSWMGHQMPDSVRMN